MPIERFDDKAGWLRGRKSGIGGGQLAAILGEGKRASAYSIWWDKITPEIGVDPGPGNERMQWGLDHESTIARVYSRRTGRPTKLWTPNAFVRHPRIPYCLATPDAMQYRAVGEEEFLPETIGVLEIKTTDTYMRAKWKDGCPKDHWIQVQHTMQCSRAKWGTVVGLIGGNELVGPFDFMRDDAWYESIEPQIHQFWECVLNHTPPPIDDSKATEETLREQYRRAVPGVTTLDRSLINLVPRWGKIRKLRKKLEEMERGMANQIMAAMKESTVGLLPDGRTVTYRQSGKGRRLKLES